MVLRAISLCSGIGGLDLGLRSRGVRTVCYVEREAFPAAVLVKAMEEGRLDPAPIWSDVRSFDPAPFRGCELVFGGIPCQPWSNAGLRKGHGDERDLLGEAFRIFDESGASVLFLENVGGFRRALPRLLEEAAARGLDAVWDRFTAAEVGAPHRRLRYFVLLADAERLRRAGVANAAPGDNAYGQDPGREKKARRARKRDSDAADTERLALRHQTAGNLEQGEPIRQEPGGACEARTLTDTGSQLLRQEQGRAKPGREGAPEPRDDGEERRATWWQQTRSPEPVIRRMDDGAADRVDRLRALGNGVVPQQAALAWDTLWSRLLELQEDS